MSIISINRFLSSIFFFKWYVIFWELIFFIIIYFSISLILLEWSIVNSFDKWTFRVRSRLWTFTTIIIVIPIQFLFRKHIQIIVIKSTLAFLSISICVIRMSIFFAIERSISSLFYKRTLQLITFIIGMVFISRFFSFKWIVQIYILISAISGSIILFGIHGTIEPVVGSLRWTFSPLIIV